MKMSPLCTLSVGFKETIDKHDIVQLIHILQSSVCMQFKLSFTVDHYG